MWETAKSNRRAIRGAAIGLISALWLGSRVEEVNKPPPIHDSDRPANAKCGEKHRHDMRRAHGRREPIDGHRNPPKDRQEPDPTQDTRADSPPGLREQQADQRAADRPAAKVDRRRTSDGEGVLAERVPCGDILGQHEAEEHSSKPKAEDRAAGWPGAEDQS